MRWRRRFARFLAPVAFLAALTVAVQIVRAGLRGDDEGATTTVATSTPTATTRPATTRPAETTPTSTHPARPTRQFYVIEAGDTLDKVALEHGTSVARLLELNPGIDTTSLQIGQRIRVE